jgi:ATP-dependent Clp protease ATP-binding subunit ClpC
MKAHFTTQVKEIISYSAEEAIRLQTSVITPAHLVLGMIRQGQNPALTILTTDFGLSPAELKTRIENTLPPSPPPRRRGFLSGIRVPLDREAETVIRGGVKKAAGLKSPQIGAEHLLLALLDGPHSQLTNLFSTYGISYTSVYKKVPPHG